MSYEVSLKINPDENRFSYFVLKVHRIFGERYSEPSEWLEKGRREEINVREMQRRQACKGLAVVKAEGQILLH